MWKKFRTFNVISTKELLVQTSPITFFIVKNDSRITKNINDKVTHYKQDPLQDPSFLTIACNYGGLGNQMFTYASLLGLSKMNKRTPYAPKCNMDTVRRYFKVTAAEISELSKQNRREYPLGPYFRPKDAHIPKDKNILTGYEYPNSFTFFDHIRDEIRKEFQFKESIISYAQTYLHSLKNVTRKDVTFVGVHVRRTDYCKWLQIFYGRQVNMMYFKQAIEYFQLKYSRVIFVVVSDDKEWCKRKLGTWPNVFVGPEPTNPAYDMAIMSQCNHTIMTYGTFGFWCAYLAGGETIYFDEYIAPNSSFLIDRLPFNKTFLPNWIGISAKTDHFWKEFETNGSCNE
ncbi:galactoside alpha-(1,2)-fucosyltransferase 2-like [Centruroides vittatus]|uniref:galactoside alpha-(1,2)-fucosyltransferase 2-like n=1 Tax=Centruroides vittatus TaxID=120091 RepID=UPI00350F7D54